MEVARRFTRRLHELPSEELELIAGLFVRREVHKGELLISEKDIARDIVFVEKGLLRQFYFKEGRDITENFACDGDGAMCIVSLFTGRRNCLQLESLEVRKISFYSSGAFRMQDLSNSLSVICI